MYVRGPTCGAGAECIKVVKSNDLCELYYMKAEGVTGVMDRVLKEGLEGSGRETATMMMLVIWLEHATVDLGIITARAAAGRDQGVDWIELNLLLIDSRLPSLTITSCTKGRLVVRGGFARTPHLIASLLNAPTVAVGSAATAYPLSQLGIHAVLKTSFRPSADKSGRRILGLADVPMRGRRQSSGARRHHGFISLPREWALVRA